MIKIVAIIFFSFLCSSISFCALESPVAIENSASPQAIESVVSSHPNVDLKIEIPLSVLELIQKLKREDAESKLEALKSLLSLFRKEERKRIFREKKQTKSFMENEGVEALVLCLRSSNIDLVKESLLVVTSLCFDSLKAQKLVYEKGALTAILDHFSSESQPELNFSLINALINCVMNYPSAQEYFCGYKESLDHLINIYTSNDQLTSIGQMIKGNSICLMLALTFNKATKNKATKAILKQKNIYMLVKGYEEFLRSKDGQSVKHRVEVLKNIGLLPGAKSFVKAAKAKKKKEEALEIADKKKAAKKAKAAEKEAAKKAKAAEKEAAKKAKKEAKNK